MFGDHPRQNIELIMYQFHQGINNNPSIPSTIIDILADFQNLRFTHLHEDAELTPGTKKRIQDASIYKTNEGFVYTKFDGQGLFIHIFTGTEHEAQINGEGLQALLDLETAGIFQLILQQPINLGNGISGSFRNDLIDAPIFGFSIPLDFHDDSTADSRNVFSIDKIGKVSVVERFISELRSDGTKIVTNMNYIRSIVPESEYNPQILATIFQSTYTESALHTTVKSEYLKGEQYPRRQNFEDQSFKVKCTTDTQKYTHTGVFKNIFESLEIVVKNSNFTINIDQQDFNSAELVNLDNSPVFVISVLPRNIPNREVIIAVDKETLMLKSLRILDISNSKFGLLN